MKIYIYWGEQKYFTSFEDVRDYFERHWGASFEDFLNEHYTGEDIFNFTKDERENVIKDYKNTMNDELEAWIEDYCDVVEIVTECKKE